MNKHYVVTLAHAVADENGRGEYGKAGDSGNEVRFQVWYDREKGWHTVLRAKKKSQREAIASNAINGVNNQHLGYDKVNSRYSAFDYLSDKGYDYLMLDVDSECDCTQFCTTNSCYAGIPIPRDTYSGNMVARYKATGKYDAYTDESHVKNFKKLKKGDFLVGNGHAATVVNVLYWLKTTLKKDNATSGRAKDVKAVQARLCELGYDIDIDGVWGDATENAVTTFQVQNDLTNDGIIGKMTAQKLGFLWGNGK